MTNGKLTQRVALVTGGSSGIGAAIARRFLVEGARVAVFDRVPVPTPYANDDSFMSVLGDVATTADVQRCVAEIENRWGCLHILVNCAGVYAEGPLEQMPEEAWDGLWNTNVRGIYVCVRAALPLMRESGAQFCSILNIASGLAFIPEPEAAAYCASKAAVVMLTRTLGLAYGCEGIRVNAVAPGPVETSLLAASLHDEAARQAAAAFNPLGRLIAPEEVAVLATFLVSDEAAAITAATYPIDGGESALAVAWSFLRQAKR